MALITLQHLLIVSAPHLATIMTGCMTVFVRLLRQGRSLTTNGNSWEQEQTLRGRDNGELAETKDGQ